MTSWIPGECDGPGLTQRIKVIKGSDENRAQHSTRAAMTPPPTHTHTHPPVPSLYKPHS